MDEQPKKKTSKLAIAAFVCLIAPYFFVLILFVIFSYIGMPDTYSLYFFLAVKTPLFLSLILGVAALIDIARNRAHLKGCGIALLSIFAFIIFMFVIIPLLRKVPGELHSRLKCATNLKGLGTAMTIYADKFNDKWSNADKWNDFLMKECNIEKASFNCAEAKEGLCNYAMNKYAVSADMPAAMILLFDSKAGWNQVGGAELLTTENHNGEGCNILFGDGHVEFVKTEDLPKLKWK